MNDNENKTNAPTIELLPCPFCGATPNVEQIGNDATRKVRSRKTGIRVKCPTFGCCTEKFVGIIRESFEWATNAVIENWNKRAALNEADALRAEVEGYRAMLADANRIYYEHPLRVCKTYHGDWAIYDDIGPINDERFNTALAAYAAIKPNAAAGEEGTQ